MAKLGTEIFYVEFNGVEIETGKSFEVAWEQKEADSTTFGDVYENTVKTKKAIGAKATVMMQVAPDAIQSELEPGDEAALIWGREGNGTGKPKGGFTGRVKKVTKKFEVGGVATFDVEWSNAGSDILYNENSDVF
jgi:hypothetical protein